MPKANELRAHGAPLARAKLVAVYARTAADDHTGTACRTQVRETLRLVADCAAAAVYADPARSGLDAGRPGLRRLLTDVRRGGLRRVIVRDLARLARSAAHLGTILGKLRAAGVELLTLEGAERHA